MKFSTILSSLFVSSLVSLAKAEKYNVIALPSEYGGTSVGLVIDNNAPIPMNPSVNGMYWTVDANKPSAEYHYVILNDNTTAYGEKENLQFVRQWSDEQINHIFGRRIDRAGNLLKTIPRAYPAHPGYTKFSKLFQEGEMPVVRFFLNDQDYNTLMNDTGEGIDNKYVGSFDLFTADEIYQFTNATLELGGMGSRGFKKHPFKISLSEGENDSKTNTEIFGRDNLKFRNLVYDSSYIKNKIATDVMISLGLPAVQSTHARLYINNTPFGLYDFSDVTKKKFVKHFFHSNDKKGSIKYGTFYKGISTITHSGEKVQAFLYNDFPELREDMYEPAKKVIREGAQPLDDINEVIQWIDTLTDTTPPDEIRNRFNLDVFYKSMALEYLTCHWDGYLQGGNNFYLYRDVSGYITMFSFDFDLTFGKWCKFEKKPFEEFSRSLKNYGGKGVIFAQLYHKILNREPFKTEMKQTLDEVVSKIFNIEALGDRIAYLKEFLKDDIAWDISVRNILPSSTYSDTDEEPIPSYDGAMALFDNNPEQIEDDYGVYNWIKDTSEYIAATDNVKFAVDRSNGEVGGIIETKKNGDAKVDGDISNGSTTLVVNAALLIVLSYILMLL